jgi:RNA polymerase sigma-70 factor (ECF subfamily)
VENADLMPAHDAGRPQPDADPDPLALLSRGDRRGAISALMDLHGEAVFGFCVRMLGDRALAEDVLQQVFLEAHRDIDRYQGRSSLITWLKGIANHRCKDAIKSRTRREKRVDPDDRATLDVIDPNATPDQRLDQARTVAALEACLAELSDDVRMSVVLRFQSGMTYDEMSVVLEAKPDALHARVSRALPVLKRCLETKGWMR